MLAYKKSTLKIKEINLVTERSSAGKILSFFFAKLFVQIKKSLIRYSHLARIMFT